MRFLNIYFKSTLLCGFENMNFLNVVELRALAKHDLLIFTYY